MASAHFPTYCATAALLAGQLTLRSFRTRVCLPGHRTISQSARFQALIWEGDILLSGIGLFFLLRLRHDERLVISFEAKGLDDVLDVGAPAI